MKVPLSYLLATCCVIVGGCTTHSRSTKAADSNACSLSAADLKERKELLRRLTQGVVQRKNLADGVAYRFDPGPGVVARLARLVELESDCCQFLTFKVIAERDQGPVWLEISGPSESQAAIHDYFDQR